MTKADYDEGYDAGREDVNGEVEHLLTNPQTDDPLDTLRAVAEAVGAENYDYFDDKGSWVLYPQAGA